MEDHTSMSSSIDEQFVEFVVKSLVNKPDAVKVNRTIDEKGVLLELTVDPEDLGRVIGKRGVTAQSIRTLLRALGVKNDARYNLKIVDNGNHSYLPRESDHQVQESSVNVKDQIEEVETSSETGETKEKDEEQETQDQSTDRLSKTRQELEDLDDLDI